MQLQLQTIWHELILHMHNKTTRKDCQAAIFAPIPNRRFSTLKHNRKLFFPLLLSNFIFRLQLFIYWVIVKTQWIFIYCFTWFMQDLHTSKSNVRHTLRVHSLYNSFTISNWMWPGVAADYSNTLADKKVGPKYRWFQASLIQEGLSPVPLYPSRIQDPR